MGFNEYIIVHHIYTLYSYWKYLPVLSVQYSIQALKIQVFENMKFRVFSASGYPVKMDMKY